MDNNLFPKTKIGDLSVSRLIMGTNNIMGGSHRSKARDLHIKEINNNKRAVADIVKMYLSYGVDTIIGIIAEHDFAMEGIRLAEQETGQKVNTIELAIFDVADTNVARAQAKAKIKQIADAGIDICMPLHTVVENLMDKQNQKMHRIEDYLYMIREENMIPGLSAHMPEVIEYSDLNQYDVETYIQIYNVAGFLMQKEIETVHKVIHNAKKPVLTIKPMAAGHLNPFVGVTFSFNTIREQDMVAVGCMTPLEAQECIEYALAAIERRPPDIEGRLHQYHQ